MTGKETVQEIYAAFGRGDVPAILERLAPDVEWEYGASPTEVPWLQPRQGRAGAAEFFASLANLEFHRFEPKMILEEGATVNERRRISSPSSSFPTASMPRPCSSWATRTIMPG
ncbi:MAG: nuclear transport factor 2 family protein [Thermoanaerobaculia bacterium]